MRRLALVVALFLAASIVAACGTSSGLLKKQLRTPLECPCPTIAPLAVFNLPSANTYLGGVTSGPDGNIWISESDANKVARVTLNGTITEFQIPTAGAYPAIIAPGPDGNLWSTDYNLNLIHRITPAGGVTEFFLPPPLATAPQNLVGIAAGPDGNIWFAHPGANVIGVMSTSGNLVATYPIPTANSGAGLIVKGPDGNMWFTEGGLPTNCVFNIAKITMSGAITEFAMPTIACNTAYGSFGGLVVGSDGNIWFTERYSAKIGRITPAGVITEFAVPANPSTDLLNRIVTTPDGALWFDQREVAPPWNSQVGKLNLSGVVTDLWSFPGGKPDGMTVGADGSPWFTDHLADTVIRL
jgi:streptogramin lyase